MNELETPTTKGKKTYLPMNVNDAADSRFARIFDDFDKICVSFSGGKDSTVLLDKAAKVAAARGRVIDVLFIDWEAQYQATIDHVTEALTGRPELRVWWVCLPMSTCNESSFHEPMWTAWDETQKARWVRPLPEHPGVINDPSRFPWYRQGMTFEEFVPAFNLWYAGEEKTAFLVGIRSDESLNRFRAIKREAGRKRYDKLPWTTQVAKNAYNFYPLYDWRVEDIWTYIGRSAIPYNHIYDRMYRAGMGLHEMRICEPYSREARKHLDKYHQLEPQTWEKIAARAGGVNFGKLYGSSELLGYRKITKPETLTWKQYAAILLDSLPAPLQAHYRRRIDVFIGWFVKNRGWDDLKEESDLALEMKNQGGSWRMVCRTLLRNDYLCTHLCFQMNKNELDKFEALKEKYKNL